MADIWLQGFDRRPIRRRSGRKYDRTSPKKALLHTTEGGSLEGAERAYAKYPPHIAVCFKTRRRWQHIPLNRGGYALAGSESEDEPVIQIEIVGYAASSHNWSDADLKWLAEDVLAPIHRAWPFALQAPPAGFRGADEGIYPYLASSRSPIRFTDAEFVRFSGILGHQHAPAPDHHWDPGRVDIDKLLRYLRAALRLDEEAITEKAQSPMTPEEKKAFDQLAARVANIEVDVQTVAGVVGRTTSPFEQVSALYETFLKREPGLAAEGFRWWVGQVKSGAQSLLRAGRAIHQSPEAVEKRRK